MQWFRRLIGTTDSVEPGGATDTAQPADSTQPADAASTANDKAASAAGAKGKPSGDPGAPQTAEQVEKSSSSATTPKHGRVAAASERDRAEEESASSGQAQQAKAAERDTPERRSRKTRKNARNNRQSRSRDGAPASTASAASNSKVGNTSVRSTTPTPAATAPRTTAARTPEGSATPKPAERRSYSPPPRDSSPPPSRSEARPDLKAGVKTVHAIAVAGNGQPRVAPPPRTKPKGEMGPDLDAIFDQLEAGGMPQGLTEADVEAAVEEARANAVLFQQMAYEHARPLREFMLELAMGATARQWLDVVLPLVENLYKSAAALGQESLAKSLVSYHRSLISASKQPASKVGGLARERLLSGYQAVIAAMPEAFDFGEERKLREPLLVQHLLRQVPGVHKNTIDKLYGAGLGSLDALCRSTTADLVAMGQVDEARAQAIVRHFRSYRDERLTSPKDPERSHEQSSQRLGELSEQLAEAQEAFAKAEEADDRRRKREARSRRQAITLEMIVLLIQSGEVDLAEAIERSATHRKLEQVRTFVEQSADPPEPARFS